MADINVDVNLPSTISVDITSPTQALATNISIPGPQGPRGEKGNPTSINSLTAENIIITGSNGNIVSTSGTSTIFISGNSGYFESRVNTLTTNLNSTGSSLLSTINISSGYLQNQLNNLDSNYATDSDLFLTGQILNQKINIFSGTYQSFVDNLDASYATDTQLQNTGSTLSQNINSLSGTLTNNYYLKSNPSGFITGVDLNPYLTSLNASTTYATITNLDLTGNTLNTRIDNLGNIYVTKSNGQFSDRPTVNGTGILLSGEAAGLPTTILYTTGNQIKSGRLIIGNDAGSIIDPNSPYTLSLQSNNLDTFLEFLNNGGSGKGGFIGMNGGDQFELYNWQGGDIIFFTAENPSQGIDRLYIKNDGKIGIGTNIPSEKLEVIGNIKGNNIYANNLIYNTGTQTISGVKTFDVAPTLNGNPFITGMDLSSYLTSSNASTTYATISNLALTGSTLQTQINNLGDTYATDLELSTIQTNLNNKINSLSGDSVLTYNNQTINGKKTFTEDLIVQKSGFFWSGIKIGLNSIIISEESIKISGDPVIVQSIFTGYSGDAKSTYATNTNLALTGSTLNTRIDNLGTTYATNTNLALTGSTLDIKINSLSSNSVLLNGDQSIGGIKTFRDKVYINNLYVTGTETILNTTNNNIASPYLLLNLTGGLTDGGIFFVTGVGLTGINDTGIIFGFDNVTKSWHFGQGTRLTDISTLDEVMGIHDLNGYSGYANQTFSTITNLESTGSTLDTKINDFSGELKNSVDWENRQLIDINSNPVLNWYNTNVGIGTTSPSERLEVSGTIKVKKTENNFQETVLKVLSTENSAGTTWRGRTIIGAENLTFLMGTYNGIAALGAHSWSSANTEDGAAWADLSINPDGPANVYIGGSNWDNATAVLTVQNSSTNVGIGTNSPNAKLHVYDGNLKIDGNTDSTQSIYFMDDNNNNNVFELRKESVDFNTYGVAFQNKIDSKSYPLILEGSANVGVGTDTPSEKLHVNGNILANNINAANNINVIGSGFFNTINAETIDLTGFHKSIYQFINSITLTGADVTEANGTWTRSNGGSTSFSNGQPSANLYWDGTQWLLFIDSNVLQASDVFYSNLSLTFDGPWGFLNGATTAPTTTSKTWAAKNYSGIFFVDRNELSLSGSGLNVNIASTGTTLNNRINSLSGNLASTGSTLNTNINNLSGASVLTFGNQLINGTKTFNSGVVINVQPTGTNPALYITGTWNDANIPYSGLVIDITDTNSKVSNTVGDTSYLLELKKNGSSQIALTHKTNYSTSLPSIHNTSNNLNIGRTNTSLYFGATQGGNAHATLTNNGFTVRNSSTIGWSVASAGSDVGSQDLILAKDLSGILAQRNGTNPQQFRVYNSTGTNSGEFGLFGWQNNNLIIGSQATNSGIFRDTIITGNNIYLGATGGSIRINPKGQIFLPAPSSQNLSDASINAGTAAITLFNNETTMYGFSSAVATFNNQQVRIWNGATLGFAPNNYGGNTPDVVIQRDTAGILAQRNGTNPQQFRVYNTTGTNSGEFGLFGWQNNQLIIGSQATNSGILRNITITGSGIINLNPLTSSNYLRFNTNQNNAGYHEIGYSFHTANSNSQPVKIVAQATQANGRGYLEFWIQSTGGDGDSATAADKVLTLDGNSVTAWKALGNGSLTIDGSSSTNKRLELATDLPSQAASTLLLKAGNANYINRAGGELIISAGKNAGNGTTEKTIGDFGGAISFRVSTNTGAAGDTNTLVDRARLNYNGLGLNTLNPQALLDISGLMIASGAQFRSNVDIYNSTNPQSLRIFNSTGTNSGEFGLVGWVNSGLVIGPQQTTSGILRDLTLTGNNININASGVLNIFDNTNIVGNLTVSGNTTITGHLSASSKSFLIDHPTQIGKKLQYGSLEGPEHGVFVRGKTNANIIDLPNYWSALVDENSISVNLTPISAANNIYVVDYNNQRIITSGNNNNDYFYTVYGERKDIPKLIVEF